MNKYEKYMYKGTEYERRHRLFTEYNRLKVMLFREMKIYKIVMWIDKVLRRFNK